MTHKKPFDDGSIPPDDPILAGLIIVVFVSVTIALAVGSAIATTWGIYEIGKHVLGVWG